MSFVTMKHLRAHLARLLVLAMMLTLILPTGVMAAEPNHGNKTEVSLKSIFSAKYYAQNNPDVYAAFGDDENLLYQHYVQYGIKEGRRYLSPVLDVRAYRAGNMDLQKAFGDDWLSYVWHFLNYGVWENAAGKRSSKGILFNPIVYLNDNPNVQSVTGGDLIKIIEYYIAQGMPAGSWVNQPSAGPKMLTSTSVASTNESSASGNTSSDGNSENANRPVSKPTSTSTSTVSGKPDVPTPTPTPSDDPVVDPDNPDEEHSKDSLHTKNSFGDDGLCLWGCGLTLAEFQQSCTENHDLHIGQTCSECGFEGELDHTWDKTAGECTGCDVKCPNIGNHADILQGETCNICGYEGTKSITPPAHEHSWATTWANDADAHWHECAVDDCDVTDNADKDGYGDHTFGEWNSTKEPTAEEVGFRTRTCTVCGYAETEEIPKVESFVCPNAANHVNLHKGVACGEEGCDYVGEAEHTFVSGECTGCDATCTPETCPDKENHKTDAGYTCDTCGYKVPDAKEPDKSEQKHPDGYAHKTTDYENGVCTICDEPCPKTADHENKFVGEICDVCGVAGRKLPHEEDFEHQYEDFVNGVCAAEGCGYTLSEFQMACTENGVNHAELECGTECTGCHYIVSSQHQYEYNEVTGTSTCAKCYQVCQHVFVEGQATCLYCSAPNTETGCTEDFHKYCSSEGDCPKCGKPTYSRHVFGENGKCNDCDAIDPNHEHNYENGTCTICKESDPNYVVPEHVHDWSAQDGTCAGTVGTCGGCPNADGHAEILTTDKCEICGVSGTRLYAYTSANCPGHAPDENNVCALCGLRIPASGETEEELDDDTEVPNSVANDPSKGGNAGVGGGSSTDDDTTVPQSEMPDASLPIELMTDSVVEKTGDDSNGDPEPENERDEAESGGDDDGEDDSDVGESGGTNETENAEGSGE